MEFLGTLILVLTIQLSVGAGAVQAPLAIGLVLAAIVYLGFPISKAHYNPAVSLCIFARGSMTLHEMLMYWIFQFGGGAVGALLGGIIGGKFIVLSSGEGVFFLQAFLAELVFTALLCFVILGVATNSKVEGNQYYGGMFLLFCSHRFYLSRNFVVFPLLTIYVSLFFLSSSQVLSALLFLLASSPSVMSVAVASTPQSLSVCL